MSEFFKLIKNKTPAFLKRCGLPDMLLIRFLAVFFIISGINIHLAVREKIFPVGMWREFAGSVSLSLTLIIMALTFILLTAAYYFMPEKLRITDNLLMFAGMIFFALSAVWKSNNFYFGAAMAIIAAVLSVYLVRKTKTKLFSRISTGTAAAAVITTAAATAFFIAFTTVFKHRMFGTTAYDMGIFIQMFHSMTDNLSAVTTCERGSKLSHFFVHSSYIFYLLVPVYRLFPGAETLLTIQALLAVGGIIPFFLIAKNHGFKGMGLILVSMMYIFCSGIISPCNYDFHENAFLPLLLMWLLYAADRRNIPLMYIMSALVCMVKEDSPLYVICIGLFFLFEEKSPKRFHGLTAAAVSAVYFVLINKWLAEYGDGNIMLSSRFGNLTIEKSDGFAEIIRNVFADPAYFISLMLREESLLFFFEVMLPIMFLPFITGKIHRFILMLPFVIMNLVVGSGYQYAVKIGYQYIFGTVCLLLFMALLNLEDMKRTQRKAFIISAASASVITAFSLCSGQISYYTYYRDNKAHFQAIEECLATIPENASAASDNPWYVPHIAERAEVYYLSKDYFIGESTEAETRLLKSIEDYDFYVMDGKSAAAMAQLEAAGYYVYSQAEGDVVIYSKAS